MKKILLFAVTMPLLLIGCSKDDDNSIKLSKTEYSLHYEDEVQIEAISEADIKYHSQDEFVAEVSPVGLITGGRVGETLINLANDHDAKTVVVKIAPRHLLYDDPYVKFGASRNEVIRTLGTPDQQLDNSILYGNILGSNPIFLYLFDDSDKLKTCGVLVSLSRSSQLADFLLERYLVVNVNSDDYTALFINALSLSEATLVVGMAPYNTSYIMLAYFEPSNTKASSLISGKQRIIEEYENIIK
jgi:hypothetical protein